MHFFALHPAWNNFSATVREAAEAEDAKTSMERAHHTTAALYFGVAALEAFINGEMRGHLSANGEDERGIYNTLRKTSVVTKLTTWPETFGMAWKPEAALSQIIEHFNTVRGALTHPKTRTADDHKRLALIHPTHVVAAVADYIVNFKSAQAQMYPYWIFGWNYFGPRLDDCEIILVNEQQFGFSLQAMGLPIEAWQPGYPSPWQRRLLMTYAGYAEIRDSLRGIKGCEPKDPPSPYRPILCRRWWDAKHQSACGHATRAAIDRAVRGGPR